MSRPRKVIKNVAERKKHEAALARRRERHAQAKGLEQAKAVAAEGAESEADFQALVAAEQKRIESQNVTTGKMGGAPSQKKVIAARENLSLAFDLMGGVAALVVWGRQNPTEFYRLWARLIPKESVEVSAQLPLEALLEKLNGRSSAGMSVAEAAYSVGSEVLEEARVRVLEHVAHNPDERDPYEDHDEETIQ